MNEEHRSPFDDLSSENPFASPQFAQPSTAPSFPTHPARDDVPGFPKAVAIIDLVFCAIRLLLVALALVAVSGGIDPNDELLSQTAWPEILAGAGITIFATIAAIGILCKAEWAVPTGWLAVAATAASIAVALWQLSIVAQRVMGTPDGMPFLVGAGGAFIIRAGLLVMYGFALRNYAAWLAERPRRRRQVGAFDAGPF